MKYSKKTDSLCEFQLMIGRYFLFFSSVKMQAVEILDLSHQGHHGTCPIIAAGEAQQVNAALQIPALQSRR